MKSLKALLLLITLLCAPSALAQTGSTKTTSTLNTEVNTLWGDNTTGQITPFDARQTLLDIIASTGVFSTANTWTALQTHTAGIIANGTGIAINPTAASLNPGLSIVQSGPTSGSGSVNCLADLSSSYCFNSIVITADAYNLANQGMNALAIDYGYGGSNMQGARNGLTVYSHLNNAGNASNPNPFYGAINSVWEAFGPDISSSAAVNITAFTLLQSGATGYHSITAIEIDAGMVTTGGAAYRVGLDVASIGSFQGASGDYAITVSAGSGSPGWLTAVALNHFNGAAPLDATNGCIICTDGSSDTIKTGIDFSSYTVTGNAFKSNNFQVSGNGVITGADSGTWGSGGINGSAIGGMTPEAGAFTTLSASSTVSGTGFSTYLASPPAIGGSAAAAITGTTIRANTGFSANGNAGLSTVCTVTSGNSLTFTEGLLTTKGANCT